VANINWKDIADAYRKRIEGGLLKAGDRLGSETDIAEEFGVSRPTAHRAIHELQRQGFVTRQRRWGTVVSHESARQTGRVALIFDRFAPDVDFPRSDLLRGVHEGLGDDVGMMLVDSKDDVDREAHLIKKLRKECDGIILTPIASPKNTALIQRQVNDGYPMVLLDRVPANLTCNAVVSDNRSAMIKALDTLKARGHQNIAFFAFDKPEFSTIQERFEAFQQVTGNDKPHLVRFFARELELNQSLLHQAVHDAVFTLVNQKDPATAIFSTQDGFAVAIIDVADQLGIRIPEDLELATFNDWPPMMLRRPWQTHRVVQQTHRIGFEAALRLRELIDHREGEVKTLRIPAEIVLSDAGLNRHVLKSNL
jgi:DNA-binding LacI/PurR family transcriptional regulator